MDSRSEPSFPRELERQLRIADSILRVMITKKQVADAPVAPAAVEVEEPSAESEVVADAPVVEEAQG